MTHSVELVARVRTAIRAEEMTFKEIGEHFGITARIVRRIHQRHITGEKAMPVHPGRRVMPTGMAFGVELMGEEKARYERFVEIGFPKGDPKYNIPTPRKDRK